MPSRAGMNVGIEKWPQAPRTVLVNEDRETSNTQGKAMCSRLDASRNPLGALAKFGVAV